jgi:CubicO group peptidase (beta-lactamase class C family)
MSKRWNRPGLWLALVAGGVGLLVMAIAGLHVYVTATATPLHPDPARISSVTRSDPARPWLGAVERSRQAARAALVEQNLPGLSVAVGVGQDVVWAEGFGWADLENRVPVTPERRFRIGTASIMLTSAAVGVLLEKGRLKLDDPIQASVPEFPKKQGPVTLRELMGHLAGVGTDSGDEGPLFGQHSVGGVDAVAAVAGKARRFDTVTESR